jgi:hypothetical protein
MMRPSMRPTADRIFCACAPGLEPVLAAELSALGLDARAVPGGAEASGEDAAALACLASRAADAVLLRLWEGDPADLAAAKRAAARRAGGAALVVRTGRGRATISVDAAGAPLFRRGWRARVGAAPLRETLAAGILLACGWKGDRPFLDPMCGSGTIAIEPRSPPPAARPVSGAPSRSRLLATTPAAPDGSARLAALARPVPVPSTRPIATRGRSGSRRGTPRRRGSRTRSASRARTPRGSSRRPVRGCARRTLRGASASTRRPATHGARSRRSSRASPAGRSPCSARTAATSAAARRGLGAAGAQRRNPAACSACPLTRPRSPRPAREEASAGASDEVQASAARGRTLVPSAAVSERFSHLARVVRRARRARRASS